MEGPAATDLAAERRIDPRDGSASPGNVRRVRRPAAVTILAIVQLVAAAGYGLILLALLVGGTAALETVVGGEADRGPVIELELATLILLVGGATVAALSAAILLLRMHQLGWTLTMLLAGVSLASSIYLWWAQGTTVAIFLVVQVVTVFYLNQRQVRSAFGIGGRQAGTAPDPGRR